MNRPKRATAGNRMAKVMEEKECTDEFYKTNYGGFQETDSDNEFQAEDGVEEGDDTVDSDFSIDENEESVTEVNGEAATEGNKRACDEAEAPQSSKKPKLNSTEENASAAENGDTSQEKLDESREAESTAEVSSNKIEAETNGEEKNGINKDDEKVEPESKEAE